jgi:tRNA pseudouridine13 synthase
MDISLTLPYTTKDLPGIGGKLRKTANNFIVEEIPLYEPQGKGEHLYVNITKEGLTTKEVQRKLANLFKIPITSIGFAGMKDKNARTTQTFSIKVGRVDERFIEQTLSQIKDNLPVTVNWAKLHKNKLRVGHLLGNRFIITITDLEVSPEEALEKVQRIKEEIKRRGLPNFFGPQRFGLNGKNIRLGLEIIKGERSAVNNWTRRFLISSYQSYLCNLYLIYRLETGNFDKILKGDIAKKYDTGGLFEVENVEKEQIRYENHEISFTAPIYGYKMWETKGPAQELEAKVLGETGMSMEQFRNAKIKGTRRLGRLLIPDLDVKLKSKDLVVSFSLPKGAFATTVLREIMKSD